MANRQDRKRRLHDDDYLKYLATLVKMLRAEQGSGQTYAIITQVPNRRPEFVGYHQGDTSEMSTHATEHEAYLIVAPIDARKSTNPLGMTLADTIETAVKAKEEEKNE